MERVFPELPGTEIWVGDDPFTRLTGLLAQEPPGSVVICTGRHSAERSGAWAVCEQAVAATGRTIVHYSAIDAEPECATVRELTALLRREYPAAVVALGGGSVMDAAKAAFLTAQAGGDVTDYFGVNRFSSRRPPESVARVICIPTTSGTGSEATPYANIVDAERGVKKLISDPALVPAVALVAPNLAMTMPPDVTRATGCDALAHALEGFLNVGADSASASANDWARAAIRRLVANLPRALAAGDDLAARREVALAATLGGMVIRFKSTGLPHLCSFSWFGKLPHGIAVAMLLPAAWRYYLGKPEVAARTMELAEIFPGRVPEEVIASYRSFLTGIGVPKALRDCPGITLELLAATAAGAGENRMKLELAPRPVPLETASEVLVNLLYQAYQGE